MAAPSAAEIDAQHIDEKYSLEKHSDNESHNGLKIDHELDGIHDGLEFPTEEERATFVEYPTPFHGLPIVSPETMTPSLYFNFVVTVIAVVEFAERFSVGFFCYICIGETKYYLISSTARA